MEDESKLQAVQHIMATLFSAQNALRALAPEFRWAGLGNLLGDYGEYVAITNYGLTKAPAGANGYDAVTRVKLLKILWDAIGTEFGGRHELYERNYAGNYEMIRLENLLMSLANGEAEGLKKFVEQFMAEYDLDGWRVADLINPTDVNRIFGKGAQK